jgi:hypothetical protein
MPLKPHPTDPDKVVYVRREYDLTAKPMTREDWLTYLDTTWKKCLADAWQKEWDDMSRDDIIRMAREAGWKDLREFDSEMHEDFFMGKTQDLERFAALVRADEREASAKAFEAEADTWTAWPQAGAAKRKGAAAIRSRGMNHG